MNAAAVVMMIVAIAIVWGGLAASTVFLLRHPLSDDPHPHDDHDFEGVPDLNR